MFITKLIFILKYLNLEIENYYICFLLTSCFLPTKKEKGHQYYELFFIQTVSVFPSFSQFFRLLKLSTKSQSLGPEGTSSHKKTRYEKTSATTLTEDWESSSKTGDVKHAYSPYWGGHMF